MTLKVSDPRGIHRLARDEFEQRSPHGVPGIDQEYDGLWDVEFQGFKAYLVNELPAFLRELNASFAS